jgi:hypothetical protein
VTAALEGLDLPGVGDAAETTRDRDQEGRRIQVRLTSDKESELFDRLTARWDEQDVTSSHVILAMLLMLEANPELQAAAVREAREIAWRKQTDANERRSRARKAAAHRQQRLRQQRSKGNEMT